MEGSLWHHRAHVYSSAVARVRSITGEAWRVLLVLPRVLLVVAGGVR